MNYTHFISINPNIKFGKPCITDTRISVYDVLGWFASGMTMVEILDDFPQLSKEKIQACLAFAADKEHKFKIAS